jgi:hypothetical protein
MPFGQPSRATPGPSARAGPVPIAGFPGGCERSASFGTHGLRAPWLGERPARVQSVPDLSGSCSAATPAARAQAPHAGIFIDALVSIGERTERARLQESGVVCNDSLRCATVAGRGTVVAPRREVNGIHAARAWQRALDRVESHETSPAWALSPSCASVRRLGNEGHMWGRGRERSGTGASARLQISWISGVRGACAEKAGRCRSYWSGSERGIRHGSTRWMVNIGRSSR